MPLPEMLTSLRGAAGLQSGQCYRRPADSCMLQPGSCGGGARGTVLLVCAQACKDSVSHSPFPHISALLAVKHVLLGGKVDDQKCVILP